jgi:hypothetical protein
MDISLMLAKSRTDSSKEPICEKKPLGIFKKSATLGDLEGRYRSPGGIHKVYRGLKLNHRAGISSDQPTESAFGHCRLKSGIPQVRGSTFETRSPPGCSREIVNKKVRGIVVKKGACALATRRIPGKIDAFQRRSNMEGISAATGIDPSAYSGTD